MLTNINQIHLATKDEDGCITECMANTVSYVTMLPEGFDMLGKEELHIASGSYKDLKRTKLFQINIK